MLMLMTDDDNTVDGDDNSNNNNSDGNNNNNRHEKLSYNLPLFAGTYINDNTNKIRIYTRTVFFITIIIYLISNNL